MPALPVPWIPLWGDWGFIRSFSCLKQAEARTQRLLTEPRLVFLNLHCTSEPLGKHLKYPLNTNSVVLGWGPDTGTPQKLLGDFNVQQPRVLIPPQASWKMLHNPFMLLDEGLCGFSCLKGKQKLSSTAWFSNILQRHLDGTLWVLRYFLSRLVTSTFGNLTSKFTWSKTSTDTAPTPKTLSLSPCHSCSRLSRSASLQPCRVAFQNMLPLTASIKHT